MIDRITKLEHEVGRLSNDLKTVHWWDKMQAIGPILIAVVGGLFTFSQFYQSQKSQDMQAAAQLQTNREQADTALRARMFEVLVGQFFKTNIGSGEKVRLLALFENNFQGVFSAGPLFDLVAQDPAFATNRDEVDKLARTTAERQEILLGANTVPETALRKGELTNVMAGDLKLNITLTEVFDDRIRVRVGWKGWPNSKIEFMVSYFDMPLTDNTKLPGGHRFAVTLKGIHKDKNSADVRVLELDHNYLDPVDRPTFKEFSDRLNGKSAASEPHPP